MRGEQARDEGMGLVAKNNAEWVSGALQLIASLPSGEELTGEDLRLRVVSAQPDHPNAWGALVNHAVRKELLTKTGEYQKMKIPTSHARQTPVYRVT